MSLCQQAPLFPAGCTSLLQLPLYQALVLFVLDSQYAAGTVPIYRERYGSLWGRSRQAGSWGKDSNVWVWDSGQGIRLPVKFVKIQSSPSQTSTASLLSSLAEMPMNTSAMKAQLPSISPAHDGSSAEGGTGWNKPIPKIAALSKALISPMLTYKKHRKLRDCCRSGRVKCFQIWSF